MRWIWHWNSARPQRVPEVASAQLWALALPGIGEVHAGTDLADEVLTALVRAGERLQDGDVLVVSSKVVSKAMGLIVGPDVDRDAVLTGQSVREVAARRTPRGSARIVQSVAGPVLAAAGVDASNTAPGTLLLLPSQPDETARALRARLLTALQAESAVARIAVVITDTAGRPWRTGQTDFALGVAGLAPVDDLRGTLDASAQLLEVTERAVADEIAAAADLVKGKAAGTPVALVRGLSALVLEGDGPGAAVLMRPAAQDWFRHGHVEAVRTALGVPQTGPGSVPPPSVLPEGLSERVHRAVQVAEGGLIPAAAGVHVESLEATAASQLRVSGPAFWCGMLVQRLLAALWSEDVTGTLTRSPPPPELSETTGTAVALITVTDEREPAPPGGRPGPPPRAADHRHR